MREVSARDPRRVRHEKGNSQEALGPAAGVDRTYIRPLECGIYCASIDMPDKLAAVLGAEPDTLLHRFNTRSEEAFTVPRRSMLEACSS